jgi:hypothetical protein
MPFSQPTSRFYRQCGLATAVAGAVALIGGAVPASLRQELGYTDTPLIPGSKWHVHDSTRPRPAVITPGTFSTPDTPGQPPSDAVVLFNGQDEASWEGDGGKPAQWNVQNGEMVVNPVAGNIHTKQKFGDCQLHVEWAEPTPPQGNSQGRGNSGVFLMGRYEVQVLDSYDNPTYADGQAGAIYGQTPPLVNACRKPGEWQSYDIIFTAPRFENGKKVTPAYVTVLQNGVAIQNHTAILGTTQHRAVPGAEPEDPTGPLELQDHGNPIRYRNIWVRPLGSVS